MNMIKKLRSNLAFNIISAIVILLIFFSFIVSTIGYISFTNAFKREYKTATYHMANTALMLVNGNNIDKYLDCNGNDAEFVQSQTRLDTYCLKMNVSIVYVIKVDTSTYGSFTSIFNSVGENTPYTPWEIGYTQNTTNDEYAKIYKDIYENGLECGTVFRTRKLKGAPPHITTLVPVKNSGGEVVSILCIQRPMNELKSGQRPYLINIAISTVVLSVLVVISAIGYIRKQFVKPVRKVISEAQRFASENTVSNKLGDISKIDDIKNLAHSIDKMEEDMLSYINNLTSVTAEKERISTELGIASIIQENSIPNIFPAFPERKDFDIYASMTPAKEIGGDFYNFFLIDDDHLAIVIADVSGKGIPAALFMMVTNILISERTHIGGTPGEILTTVNKRICSHNKADMFVTVWLGILEISSGKLTYANAGHDDPAICKNGGLFELVKSKHGIVVGAMEDIQYKDTVIELNKGDKIFLYTDGLPEANDKDNKMFGIDNMLNSLDKFKASSPKEILDGISKDVKDFVGDAPQFDDLTMVCLELKEASNQKLTVDATNENLQKVMKFVDAFLEENDCNLKTQTQIDLSVEEIFVNIANYAYGENTGKAEISLDKNGDTVTIEFADSGTPYNPLEKDDPNITLSAEDRQLGGLGVFLVKKNMDSVSYKYENGQNILTMTKDIH